MHSRSIENVRSEIRGKPGKKQYNAPSEEKKLWGSEFTTKAAHYRGIQMKSLLS
jgi:hypothetical protein